MSTVQSYVETLKAQRDAHLAKETISQEEHNDMLDTAFDVLKEVMRAKPEKDQSVALATQHAVTDLSTALAGTQQQLAELSQAMLVLAQNSAEAKQATLAITQDIALLKKRTEKKVKPFTTLQQEIVSHWETIIADTNHFNHDSGEVSFSRVATSILSFGLGAPSQIHAAKREVFAHMKAVKAQVERLSTLISYGFEVYPNDMDAFLDSQKKLIVEDKVWSIKDSVSNTFLSNLQLKLQGMRLL